MHLFQHLSPIITVFILALLNRLLPFSLSRLCRLPADLYPLFLAQVNPHQKHEIPQLFEPVLILRFVGAQVATKKLLCVGQTDQRVQLEAVNCDARMLEFTAAVAIFDERVKA